MRPFSSFLVLCVVAVVAAAAPLAAGATETDQFTLPPQPLDDLAPDLSALVRSVLRTELERLNAEIVRRTGEAPKSPVDPIDEREFARRLFDETGSGIPETSIERAIRYGDYPGRTVQFKPALNDSIYAWTLSPFLLTHLWDCPTIRLYGIELGTDKLGHIFQHGYNYFIRYTAARESGKDEDAAIGDAVQYGVANEMTFFGVMLTGIYSNGDLAGNYAGYKFYRNLFHEVQIGDQTVPPILRLDDAHWVIDPERDDDDLLKPFVTEHLNEAYNPSYYRFSVELIRSHVLDRCANWFARVADFNEDTERARFDRMQTWYGEPYGRDLPPTDAVSLLDCFGPPVQAGVPFR